MGCQNCRRSTFVGRHDTGPWRVGCEGLHDTGTITLCSHGAKDVYSSDSLKGSSTCKMPDMYDLSFICFRLSVIPIIDVSIRSEQETEVGWIMDVDDVVATSLSAVEEIPAIE